MLGLEMGQGERSAFPRTESAAWGLKRGASAAASSSLSP